MFSDYFSVSLFFVLLRETLEISIIVSVLLAFIDRLNMSDPAALRTMRYLVWTGTLSATLIVVAVGGTIIAIWYKVGKNVFESSELLYEGIFGLIAALFLTLTSFAFLKGQYLYDKMARKLTARLGTETLINGKTKEGLANLEKSALKGSASRSDRIRSFQIFFWVPFVTVVREGIETVLLIGGIYI
jgi:high-affinity iron transporter